MPSISPNAKHQKFLSYLNKHPFQIPTLSSFQKHLLLSYITNFLKENGYFSLTHHHKSESQITDEILPAYIMELLSAENASIEHVETMLLEGFLSKQIAYPLMQKLYKLLKSLAKGKIPEELARFENESREKEALQERKMGKEEDKLDQIYLPTQQDAYKARQAVWEQKRNGISMDDQQGIRNGRKPHGDGASTSNLRGPPPPPHATVHRPSPSMHHHHHHHHHGMHPPHMMPWMGPPPHMNLPPYYPPHPGMHPHFMPPSNKRPRDAVKVEPSQRRKRRRLQSPHSDSDGDITEKDTSPQNNTNNRGREPSAFVPPPYGSGRRGRMHPAGPPPPPQWHRGYTRPDPSTRGTRSKRRMSDEKRRRPHKKRAPTTQKPAFPDSVHSEIKRENQESDSPDRRPKSPSIEIPKSPVKVSRRRRRRERSVDSDE